MRYSVHAQERFQQRFPHLVKDGMKGSTTAVFVAFDDTFNKAKEDNRLKNNTKYMVYLMDTYGDWDFEYYVNGRVLFICRNNTVVTVLDTEMRGSTANNSLGTSKHRFQNRVARTC